MNKTTGADRAEKALKSKDRQTDGNLSSKLTDLDREAYDEATKETEEIDLEKLRKKKMLESLNHV